MACRKPTKIDPDETRDEPHERHHEDPGPVDRDTREARRVGIAAHRLGAIPEAGVVQQHIHQDREDDECHRVAGQDIEQLVGPDPEERTGLVLGRQRSGIPVTTSESPR